MPWWRHAGLRLRSFFCRTFRCVCVVVLACTWKKGREGADCKLAHMAVHGPATRMASHETSVFIPSFTNPCSSGGARHPPCCVQCCCQCLRTCLLACPCCCWPQRTAQPRSLGVQASCSGELWRGAQTTPEHPPALLLKFWSCGELGVCVRGAKRIPADA